MNVCLIFRFHYQSSMTVIKKIKKEEIIIKKKLINDQTER